MNIDGLRFELTRTVTIAGRVFEPGTMVWGAESGTQKKLLFRDMHNTASVDYAAIWSVLSYSGLILNIHGAWVSLRDYVVAQSESEVRYVAEANRGLDSRSAPGFAYSRIGARSLPGYRVREEPPRPDFGELIEDIQNIIDSGESSVAKPRKKEVQKDTFLFRNKSVDSTYEIQLKGHNKRLRKVA